MKEVKKCEVCQNYFIAYRSNTVCCSQECSQKRRIKNEVARQREMMAKPKIKPKKRTGKSLVDIAVEARQAGMTYGQYVSKMGL